MFGDRPVGCLSLLAVPIATAFYVSWWQEQHPENIRSTSGLDYVLIPPVPLLGALVTYGVVYFVRDWHQTRDR